MTTLSEWLIGIAGLIAGFVLLFVGAIFISKLWLFAPAAVVLLAAIGGYALGRKKTVVHSADCARNSPSISAEWADCTCAPQERAR